jgi:hypothetical protein
MGGYRRTTIKPNSSCSITTYRGQHLADGASAESSGVILTIGSIQAGQHGDTECSVVPWH